MFCQHVHRVRDETAGSARRIVDGADKSFVRRENGIARRIKHEHGRQTHDVAWRQKLFGGFVLGRGKAPDQLFVEVAHRPGGNLFRRQVDVLEMVNGRIKLVLVLKF